MGTRNVTVIRYNGEEKVRQYGQWDGYPTAALASIVEFLKTNGNIEHLKQNLAKCRLVPEEEFVYPANFDEVGERVFKEYMNFFKLTWSERMEKCIELFDFSKKDILEYYLTTRDTGYCIPDILITNAADEAAEIVLQKTYTNECDWQIEAVNTIDLDTNRITSCWHENKMTWDFDCLPDDEAIERFEKREV